MRTLIPAAVVLCLSACASAPPAAPKAEAAPQTVASADGGSKGELICHEEPGTGTHIRRPVKVCATAEEWARRREANQKALGDMSRRGAQSAPSGR